MNADLAAFARLDLRPQKRERLADVLFGQLMQKIASGVYSEGDQLPTEKELCQLFDVSRPVVREALMRLQAEGLVVARQGAGTFVKSRPPRKLVELAPVVELSGFLRCYEVRIALEGQSARLAASRRSEARLKEIGAALATMKAAFAAGSSIRGADFAFHRAIAVASGNDLFPGMLDSLEPLMAGGMDLSLAMTGEGTAEFARRVIDEHERIYEAIANAEPDSAEIAMRFHIDQARLRMTDHRRTP